MHHMHSHSSNEEAISAYWRDGVAVQQEAGRTGQLPFAQRLAWQDVLRRQLNAKNRKLNVLDIGTRSGAMAMLMAGMKHRVTAVEPSDRLLAVARQRADESKLTVRWEQSPLDLAEIDFPPESFDAITLIDSIQHLFHPRQSFQTYQHVLKPGGRIIIITDAVETHRERRDHQRLMRNRAKSDQSSLREVYDDALHDQPLFGADAAAISGLLTYAGWQTPVVSHIAGQLLRRSKRRLSPYCVGYTAIAAEK